MIIHEVPDFRGTLAEQVKAMQEYLKKLVEELNLNSSAHNQNT